MRLFVAIDIPENFLRKFAEISARLKPAAPEARWVRPSSMHLTLKFIGEVDEQEVAGVIEALKPVRAPSEIVVSLSRVYFFPDGERFPRVLAVYLSSVKYEAGQLQSELGDLVKKIDWHLKPLGIEPEKRPYSAHVTLARLDPREKHEELKKALEPVMKTEFGEFTAREFHLYRSQLKRGGAEYTKMATFSFVERG